MPATAVHPAVANGLAQLGVPALMARFFFSLYAAIPWSAPMRTQTTSCKLRLAVALFLWQRRTASQEPERRVAEQAR